MIVSRFSVDFYAMVVAAAVVVTPVLCAPVTRASEAHRSLTLLTGRFHTSRLGTGTVVHQVSFSMNRIAYFENQDL